jgi:hypothetical protein
MGLRAGLYEHTYVSSCLHAHPQTISLTSHSDIECSTTPAFKSESVLEGMRSFLCDVEDIDGSQSGSEE